MRTMNIAVTAESGSDEGREWVEQYMKQEVADLVARKAGVPADSVLVSSGFDPTTEVALRWSIHDVLSVRADLTDEEARAVLHEAYRRHDAEVGVTWAVLEEHARWAVSTLRAVSGGLITAGGTLPARLRMHVPQVVLIGTAPGEAVVTPAGWLKVRYGFNGRRHLMLRVDEGGLVDESQYHERRHMLIRIAEGEL